MQNIALPQKIEFKKGEEQNRGLIIVEPCYPGYGTTLGNSLRRVLLSSLAGAAVVGVKIKGASHEFSAIPHVKEDILEIILNLKRLRLKVYADEAIKLELDVHGEKEVRASDIAKNSQVEIVNPDLVLAHITDMAGSLNMEIFVSCGRGYETIESRGEKKHETGYIEMDSIFTPILSVGVNIDNVRVGKMTNWDKLTLDILTDGTITPKEAFGQAAEILINQFRALSGEKEETSIGKKEEAATAPETIETTGGKGEIGEAEVKEEVKKKRGRPKKS
ncbi:DNA-directed RNA polymerase subunit alpha [Candidatus Falkowbacteria bacterium]|nr:DNA-directed RNA polymerase subunit alpha [Candidatus Falkowbacteria bacterium]